MVQGSDVYVKENASKWTFGTSKVERTVALEDGCFQLKSFKDKVSGRELLQAGVHSEEFSVSLDDGDRITGSSGGWKLDSAKKTTLKLGETQLDITLTRGTLSVIKSYVIYPGSSIIREWVTFKNMRTSPIKVIEPDFLDINIHPDDPKSLDFHWMTGGENQPGSWTLKAKDISVGKELKFDSYEPFTVQSEATGNSNTDYHYRDGTSAYAPWYALYGKNTKQGVFIGWDYFGHWTSSFDVGPEGAITARLKVAGHKQTLAPGESVTTPKAFVGLFHDDLDNAGNECLDWQYQYMWDYAREGWFPATRFLGYWYKGTNWGKPNNGWLGGKPDYDSTFRKVFLTADLMRNVGGDVYHRDWGWWDRAGDWNGPDFRSTGDYLRKYGMGQLIYAFIYTVDLESKVAKEHPDWVLGNQLDMSRPEVVEYMKGQLDHFYKLWGAYEWRNDSGMMAQKNGDDTPILAQDQGMRKVLKDFLDSHPDCAFQAVNGGGNYAGYDYIRYSSTIQFTDGAAGLHSNYHASLLFPPDKTNHMPDCWDPNAFDKATFHGLLCCNFDLTGDTFDPVKLEELRTMVDIYHYLQTKGVVGRWVHVFRPIITGDDPTMYFQRMSRDGKRGIIITKHAAPENITIQPKGLLPNEKYTVSFQETEGSEVRTGADLMEKGIAFSKLPHGELIYLNIPLHPGSKLDTKSPTPPSKVNKKVGENMGFPGVEITWNPGKDDNWVSYYEILRYGDVIDKVAKGTYYFDHSAGADLAADYQVRTVDAAGNVSGKVAADGPKATPATIYDDGTGGRIDFRGVWKRETNVLPAFAGTISVSDSKGAYAEVAFEGKKVLWFSKFGADCGKAEISIDGKSAQTIDTYSADDIYGVCLFQKEFPEAGKHTIRITVTGEHGPNSSGLLVHIDGVRVEH